MKSESKISIAYNRKCPFHNKQRSRPFDLFNHLCDISAYPCRSCSEKKLQSCKANHKIKIICVSLWHNLTVNNNYLSTSCARHHNYVCGLCSLLWNNTALNHTPVNYGHFTLQCWYSWGNFTASETLFWNFKAVVSKWSSLQCRWSDSDQPNMIQIS